MTILFDNLLICHSFVIPSERDTWAVKQGYMSIQGTRGVQYITVLAEGYHNKSRRILNSNSRKKKQ